MGIVKEVLEWVALIVFVFTAYILAGVAILAFVATPFVVFFGGIYFIVKLFV